MAQIGDAQPTFSDCVNDGGNIGDSVGVYCDGLVKGYDDTSHNGIEKMDQKEYVILTTVLKTVIESYEERKEPTTHEEILQDLKNLRNLVEEVYTGSESNFDL